MPIGVNANRLPLPVIEPGAAQALVVHLKTQGFYQVELKARIGAEANNIAGIGWNFRFVKDNMEHENTAIGE